MSAAADLALADRWTATLERYEARRLGVSELTARSEIAGKIGVSAGTLENIRRRRVKSVPSWLFARLREKLVFVLQQEIGRLEHEICIARQTGMDHRDHDLAAAEAHLVATKNLLRGE